MPLLMPCRSSPAPLSIRSRKKSLIECTAISDCPTPTVSMNTTSNPAASQRITVSLVFLATPPSEPALGLGRMNALGSLQRVSILVLSPRILPLLFSLLGSIASTASLCPLEVTKLPNASMKVLFPAPGTPVMPILIDFIPVFTACSWHAAIIFWATSLCAGRLLSTNVIAWLRIVVLPEVIPAIYSSTESSAGFFLKKFFM